VGTAWFASVPSIILLKHKWCQFAMQRSLAAAHEAAEAQAAQAAGAAALAQQRAEASHRAALAEATQAAELAAATAARREEAAAAAAVREAAALAAAEVRVTGAGEETQGPYEHVSEAGTVHKPLRTCSPVRLLA
jgi:hypothetical protein